ncbi:hypothetical protein LZ31DRAFT_193469 [Colletotrichum somersetense]|nr:hypothetical protein LZ31DRAFT_193469 [Colletotrichum somersetense]
MPFPLHPTRPPSIYLFFYPYLSLPCSWSLLGCYSTNLGSDKPPYSVGEQHIVDARRQIYACRPQPRNSSDRTSGGALDLPLGGRMALRSGSPLFRYFLCPFLSPFFCPTYSLFLCLGHLSDGRPLMQ